MIVSCLFNPAVVNVKHLYTSWEENPEERIERSKHRNELFPSFSSPTGACIEEIDGALKPEQDSAFTESSDESQKIPTIPKESVAESTEAIALPNEEVPSNPGTPTSQPNSSAVEKSTQTETSTKMNKNERVLPNPPPAPVFRPRNRFNSRPFVPFIPRLAAARAAYTHRYAPDVRPAPRFSSATKVKVVKSPKSGKPMNEQAPTNATTLPKPTSVPVESHVSKNKQTTQERSLSQDRELSSPPESKKQGDLTAEGQLQTANYGRSKYSLEELVSIQERVRASLQRQGVVSLSAWKLLRQ